MSYALELQADVQKRFRALPLGVQEAFLDLLDGLAATAAPATATMTQSSEDHVLSYEDETSSFRLFLTIESDHVNRRLTVLTLWYVAQI